ncbi:hypothetical protein FXO38_15856 [Capsicum annuum]|nr:hypothetical protein FXO38_15856 [Capsicum annuum]
MKSLSGEIPEEIANLKKLMTIDLSGNNLTGEIPSSMALCSELTLVDLSRNQLVGEVPKEITKLKNLNALNLSRKQLNGAIPGEIGGMNGLTVLDLSYNDLSIRKVTLIEAICLVGKKLKEAKIKDTGLYKNEPKKRTKKSLQKNNKRARNKIFSKPGSLSVLARRKQRMLTTNDTVQAIRSEKENLVKLIEQEHPPVAPPAPPSREIKQSTVEHHIVEEQQAKDDQLVQHQVQMTVSATPTTTEYSEAQGDHDIEAGGNEIDD